MKPSTGTIIRTVLLGLALINQFLTMKGYQTIPVDNQAISDFITLLLTGIASVWAWWTNNSFTKKAIKADEYRKTL